MSKYESFKNLLIQYYYYQLKTDRIIYILYIFLKIVDDLNGACIKL
jgi:hypothetical protein